MCSCAFWGRFPGSSWAGWWDSIRQNPELCVVSSSSSVPSLFMLLSLHLGLDPRVAPNSSSLLLVTLLSSHGHTTASCLWTLGPSHPCQQPYQLLSQLTPLLRSTHTSSKTDSLAGCLLSHYTTLFWSSYLGTSQMCIICMYAQHAQNTHREAPSTKAGTC